MMNYVTFALVPQMWSIVTKQGNLSASDMEMRRITALGESGDL
jgi:hypothetical protein